MSWLAGHGGRVIIPSAGNLALSATGWMVDYHADTIDVSNFKGVGWASYLGGVPDIDIRIDAIWDTTEDPFSPAVNLQPGESVSLQLHLDPGDANRFYDIEDGVITEILNEQAVRDTIRYSIMVKASAYFASVTIGTPSG